MVLVHLTSTRMVKEGNQRYHLIFLSRSLCNRESHVDVVVT